MDSKRKPPTPASTAVTTIEDPMPIEDLHAMICHALGIGKPALRLFA